MSTTFNVLVYGSLRKGFGNHRLLATSEHIGTYRLPNFEMKSLGGFPASYRTDDPLNSIVVELYEVNEETLTRLNMLEGYHDNREIGGNFYERCVLGFDELEPNDDGEHPGEEGMAFMYYMEPNDAYLHNRPVVPNGDWTEYKLPCPSAV